MGLIPHHRHFVPPAAPGSHCSKLQTGKSPPPPPTLPADTQGGSSSAGYLREGFVQREPAAERHDAGQLVLAGESRVQRQGAALQQMRKVC